MPAITIDILNGIRLKEWSDFILTMTNIFCHTKWIVRWLIAYDFPAHPNAGEVFYRILSRNANGPPIVIYDLLASTKAKVPLLLLWCEKDPWIRPSFADVIQKMFPAAQRVHLDAGHCAHDEIPDDVNRELKEELT